LEREKERTGDEEKPFNVGEDSARGAGKPLNAFNHWELMAEVN